MFCLLKANCQYNQLISNGDLNHGVTTQNIENLLAYIAGKANHPTTMIAAFNKRQAIFAGDDRRRQTVATWRCDLKLSGIQCVLLLKCVFRL